jgi:hypothetical protein
MTDEQINITIAEHCGWTYIEELDNTYIDYSNSKRDKIWGGINPKTGDDDFIPDYCNDLNAMHEAEKTLGADIDAYADRCLEAAGILRIDTVLLTARDKAEAFLKAIGEWEDS